MKKRKPERNNYNSKYSKAENCGAYFVTKTIDYVSPFLSVFSMKLPLNLTTYIA